MGHVKCTLKLSMLVVLALQHRKKYLRQSTNEARRLILAHVDLEVLVGGPLVSVFLVLYHGREWMVTQSCASQGRTWKERGGNSWGLTVPLTRIPQVSEGLQQVLLLRFPTKSPKRCSEDPIFSTWPLRAFLVQTIAFKRKVQLQGDHAVKAEVATGWLASHPHTFGSVRLFKDFSNEEGRYSSTHRRSKVTISVTRGH